MILKPLKMGLVNVNTVLLFTIQLLPDLLYTERMAIHIVHNGPFMLDHKQWDVEGFIHKRGEFDDED